MTIFLTGFAVWALCGLVVAGFLARHGHNFWLLALMGLGFGPFLLMIWGEALQDLPSRVTVIDPDKAQRGTGWIDVLVGLDGSAESVSSAGSVLSTLGPAIRRLRITSVIDHEIAHATDAFQLDDDRVEFLRTSARELGHDDAEIALLSGRPDKALLSHAATNKFDLVVVSHRRNEIRGALRGSTVARLARSADLPVLIGPLT